MGACGVRTSTYATFPHRPKPVLSNPQIQAAKQGLRRKSERASGTPKATSARKERHQQQHANETRNAKSTDGEEEWDSADEALSNDAARARRPDIKRTHISPNPQPKQKLPNTAPVCAASTHTQTASSPVATQC